MKNKTASRQEGPQGNKITLPVSIIKPAGKKAVRARRESPYTGIPNSLLVREFGQGKSVDAQIVSRFVKLSPAQQLAVLHFCDEIDPPAAGDHGQGQAPAGD